ncbi:hypothetical protein [Streptomyces spectabilis]|uniref:Uncharacterized protein n=1 Tax=Streptomyces spectabilis TaxID=68270 RepID=A0A5P2WZ35_STRST|nr:hypothetical protein [Streptomyces spectabilis]MBB5101256.1 hypothetical protein [Streptomyces spectabilis]MCI3900455.1 hypothetical protein [Streptomyces spectabilis]QEV58033.1 hypothetical protein CP982_04330 [Streptomyces spectabilis]GGV10255.1 hypothetical protein GCM10010245_19320 [Streptomyces spectabilis]
MDRHTFPTDLLETQEAWYVTYRQLADVPMTGAAAHRRRLLRLSQLIAAHPFWQTSAGTPAARVALKERARARTAEAIRPDAGRR